ncbi:MAG TPA: hypothetical protein VGQ92_23120 [Actinoplanes sp.]|nr:hypothetical protein [Actinoplanes sp.]
MLEITSQSIGNSSSSDAQLVSTRRATKTRPMRPGKEVSTTMSMIDRIRHRRMINRQNRAIDRAWHSAPTQAMRDEIAIFAQRKVY